MVGGSLNEGRRWLDQILAVAPPGTRERGPGAMGRRLGRLASRASTPPPSDELAECTAIAAALEDAALRAHADQQTALLRFFSGDPQTAIDLYERALAGHRRAGHQLAELFTSFQFVFALAYARRVRAGAHAL